MGLRLTLATEGFCPRGYVCGDGLAFLDFAFVFQFTPPICSILPAFLIFFDSKVIVSNVCPSSHERCVAVDKQP